MSPTHGIRTVQLTEIKRSNSRNQAQQDLYALHPRVDCDREGEPSFLAVLTGTPTAYRREDGVLVVPLTTLAP